MSTSSSSSSERKAFLVRSVEGCDILGDEALKAESSLVRSHLHNNANSDDDRTLAVPNVDFETLFLVVEFCRNRHNSNAPSHDALNALESKFITPFSTPAHTRQTLQNLMLAAETMEIQSLLDSTCTRIAELDSQQRNEGNLEIDQERNEGNLENLEIDQEGNEGNLETDQEGNEGNLETDQERNVGNLEIDQQRNDGINVETQRTWAELALLTLTFSASLIFLILAIGVIYTAIHNIDS